jgi:hypothetical protein
MHGTFCSKAGFVVPLGWGMCWATSALAQDAAPAGRASAAESPVADASPGPTTAAPQFSPGFEAGLRLGIGLPVGNVGKGPLGEPRKIGDLVTWRSPVWVDVAYRVSPVASYGLYGQVGVGGTGDRCAGKCDWSDLRLGAQGTWRLNPEANVDPWLGLGVGLESLSFQTFEFRPDADGLPFPVRTTERLLGPELLLQGGLALLVEDSLQLGPYVSASVGSYVGDRYRCTEGEACPGGSSVTGSGFHAWLGVGLSGSYSP